MSSNPDPLVDSMADKGAAQAKYSSALFLLQELNRELYHSLKFSGEENSSLSSSQAAAL